MVNRARWLRKKRHAVFFDIAVFFITLFVLGMLYLVFSAVVSAFSLYQSTNYPSGVFTLLYLQAWAWEWAAIPAVLFLSAIMALIIGARKSNLQGARV